MGKVSEMEQWRQELINEAKADIYDWSGNPLAKVSKEMVKNTQKVSKEMTSKQVGGTHYQMPIQPITFIRANKIPYIEGNIIKYVVRHEKKNGKQDLLKAMHYLEILLEDYENN